MSALAGPACRCPRTYALCADADVIGAPFYLMERVDGRRLPHARPSSTRSAPSAPPRSPAALVDMLAALHAVDPAAVGLGDFGRPEGFLERQVRRWGKQLDASRRPGRCPASTSCTACSPATSRPRRRGAGSCTATTGWTTASSAPTTEIHAVLDWEMATLGDPLHRPRAAAGLRRRSAALGRRRPRRRRRQAAPGFPTGDELVERYAAAQRPRPVRRLHWYVGVRLLQARRDPRGHPLPVHARARRSARASTGSASDGRPAGRTPASHRTLKEQR